MAKSKDAPNIRDIIKDMSPLTLGGHPITLRICEQGIETDPSTWGVYSPTTAEIILDNRQTDSCMASTLLHEVIHAAIETQGVVLPNAVEEQTVRVITSGIFSAFMANPRLLGIFAIVSVNAERERKGAKSATRRTRKSKAYHPRR